MQELMQQFQPPQHDSSRCRGGCAARPVAEHVTLDRDRTVSTPAHRLHGARQRLRLLPVSKPAGLAQCKDSRRGGDARVLHVMHAHGLPLMVGPPSAII